MTSTLILALSLGTFPEPMLACTSLAPDGPTEAEQLVKQISPSPQASLPILWSSYQPSCSPHPPLTNAVGSAGSSYRKDYVALYHQQKARMASLKETWDKLLTRGAYLTYQSRLRPSVFPVLILVTDLSWLVCPAPSLKLPSPGLGFPHPQSSAPQ